MSSLMGTGDALALGQVLGALHTLNAQNYKILPSHNFPGDRLQGNLILIGGPDANEITEKVVERLSMRLKFGDPNSHIISITDSSNGKIYIPKRNASNIAVEDYGVIVKAPNPFNPEKTVILLAGSFGHGTHGAATVLASEYLLNQISIAAEGKSFEAIVHTDVVNDWPQTPTLIQVYPL
jgi:hypothetical protein